MQDFKIFVGHNFDHEKGMPTGTIIEREKGKLSITIENCLDQPIRQLTFKIQGGVAERQFALGWNADDPRMISDPLEIFKVEIITGQTATFEIPFEIPTSNPQAYLWLVSFETAEAKAAA